MHLELPFVPVRSHCAPPVNLQGARLAQAAEKFKPPGGLLAAGPVMGVRGEENLKAEDVLIG
jgi:hypothetical protein